MLSQNYKKIEFFAEKVYFHHWPPETPSWTESRKEKINEDINSRKEKKKIKISEKSIQIENYVFDSVKKIGLTIPQFKRQCTMIFEGNCEEFHAHVHVTTRSKDYLDIFYHLMKWRDDCFSDTPFLDSKN